MRQVFTPIFLRIVLLLAPFITISAIAQTPIQTSMIDGLRNKDMRYIAITNLTIVPAPGKIIQNGTVIIKNDRIEAVGAGLTIPKGATVRDGKGLWLYAGFIEPYTDAGMGGVKKGGQPFPAASDEDEFDKPLPPSRGARYWNEAIKPEMRATESVNLDEKTVDDFRKLGFTAAQANSTDGIMRGISALVLVKAGVANDIIIRPEVAEWMSFRKGSSRNAYPSAMMGSIALIRQAFMDADWYGKAQKAYSSNPNQKMPETNLSLDALSNVIKNETPIIFETNNEHTLERAAKIAKEFDVSFIYLGSGLEYRQLAHIADIKPTIILPLNFPAVPDVSMPERANDVSLGELKQWDAAPRNPAAVDSVNIPFCFTSNGLKDKSDFWKNIRKSIDYGLSPEKALAAITTVPAQICGASKTLGTIEPGKFANLVLADGDMFVSGAIRSVYVAGDEFILSRPAEVDVRGTWRFTADILPPLVFKVSGKAESPSVEGTRDSLKLQMKFSNSDKSCSFSFPTDSLGYEGVARFSGFMDSLQARGKGWLPNGKEILWSARRDSAFVQKIDTPRKKSFRPALAVLSPDEPFGFEQIPPQQSVLLKNATIWTSTQAGVMKESDIFISGGKIAAIGKDLSNKADVTIDASGKDITPGIIDEHSHIAIEGGVNEGTHAVTAEVRIGDVLYPDDISIYRQLAGGVTSSHLLHGSANPIGGQLQLIKLRWGADVDELKFENFKGTIKFALGENVKQSNWGDRAVTRYPQTRMGVEEIMRDGFQAALEYEKQMKEGVKGSSIPPRRDIQLETLLEIIRGKRFVHCHSYVQSEILMLIRLAEEFGFKVNTFTHILEGYKVAKEMALHGAGGSTFSDWWDYKFEVYDAIPQNPAIMQEQGIVVAINSDDGEMARRLNQEAGKSVKYGGVSEENALKFVTINPAKLLYVDDRVGSLEVGKDADIVLWNGNPLSNFSRVEQTYVDGRKYFDRVIDEQMRKRDENFRAILEQRAIEAAANGDPVKVKAPKAPKKEYGCDDMQDEMKGNYSEE
ncbi:MAG: amidohydrolase family protein [Ignavibacteriae bacterium]|nr:amidohydrolase family protein [Ignavibacteriota bacterium]